MASKMQNQRFDHTYTYTHKIIHVHKDRTKRLILQHRVKRTCLCQLWVLALFRVYSGVAMNEVMGLLRSACVLTLTLYAVYIVMCNCLTGRCGAWSSAGVEFKQWLPWGELPRFRWYSMVVNSSMYSNIGGWNLFTIMDLHCMCTRVCNS